MCGVPLLSHVFRCDVAPNYLCAVSPMPYNSVSTQAPYLTTKQQELIMCVPHSVSEDIELHVSVCCPPPTVVQIQEAQCLN